MFQFLMRIQWIYLAYLFNFSGLNDFLQYVIDRDKEEQAIKKAASSKQQ